MSTLDDFFAKKDRKKKGIKSGDKGDKGDRNDKNERNDQTSKKEKTVDITDNFKYISEVSLVDFNFSCVDPVHVKHPYDDPNIDHMYCLLTVKLI